MLIGFAETAAALVTGVYLSGSFTVSFLALFLIFYLLIWLIRSLVTHTWNISSIACVLAFVLGIAVCYARSDTESRKCSDYINRYVTVTGRVSEIPVPSGENTAYVVDAVSLAHGSDEQEIKERILITSDQAFNYNDTVIFSGFLKTFPRKLNENGFDMIRYYKSKNIFFKMYSEDARVSDEPIKDYSIYAFATGVKNSISQFIDKYNHGDKSAVLKAVLIGNKKEISDELYEVLIRTGTSRCLYPAYLHLMLIMTAVGLTSGVIRRKYRDIILIAILLLYAVINSYSPVFLRVMILAAMMVFWKLRYGYADFKEMLSLTVMVIGISNPLMLFDGGFVMSVCAAVLIKCFYEYVSDKLSFIGWKYVRRVVSVGLICMVGLMPLSAYYFGGVSLYSILSTLLFIPAVAGIIISFPIVCIMTLIFGSAPLVSGFMTAMAYIIVHVPMLMDKLLPTYIILPRPTIVFILAYAFLAAAAGYYVHGEKTRSKWSSLISAALFCSFAISQLTRLGTAEVTFVNVGQGDGAVVNVPYSGAIIIDGGGGAEYSDYNVGEKVFVPYLEAEGITRIEAAFVSHYHKDHAEGVIAAVENLRVKNVFMPDVMPENKLRVQLENAARENNTKIHYISENSKVVFDNGLVVNITVPAAKTALISDDENDTSLLFDVSYGDFNCLFTGDMTKFAERNLIETGETAECDVLKVAHHGSNTATSEEWVNAVKPGYAVISVGEKNEYDLPDKEVIERLSGSKVLRTDKNGDITIIGNKHGIKDINIYRR